MNKEFEAFIRLILSYKYTPKKRKKKIILKQFLLHAKETKE